MNSAIPWDPCTTQPAGWIKLVECHPALGNYAAAAATFFAVAVAILVPLVGGVLERMKKRDQSLSFLAILLVPISTSLSDMNRVMAMIDALRAKAFPGWPGTPDALRDIKVACPPELTAALAQVYLFDRKLLGPTVSCIMQIKSFNTMVDTFATAATVNSKNFDGRKDAILQSLTKSATRLHDTLKERVGLEKYMREMAEADDIQDWPRNWIAAARQMLESLSS